MEIMSDEESFVILGSSPTPSLDVDGLDGDKKSTTPSLESDTPGSRFSSLKNSQITELKNACESSTQTPEPEQMSQEQMAGSKLWSTPPQIQIEEKMIPISLEDCALRTPLEQQQTGNINGEPKTCTLSNPNSLEASPNSTGQNKNTPPVSLNSSLASSFIMGEVNADVLKTSVYSQFPSISMEACAEDVVKLQNMVTEYMALKTTLKKVNNTMKLFYNNSLQWKDKMNTMETEYKQQIDEFHKQIEMLRKENQELKDNFKTQIEALEIVRQKDREETIQEVSEKNALLENMRAQIVKLEQQQLATFEFVPKKTNDQTNDKFDQFYVTRGEHELQMKNLQKQLSEMLASNLDFKDVEKQYVDELNCQKVNLTAAEEILRKNRADIAQLQALDIEKQQQIAELEKTIRDLRTAHAEQNERIVLLEHQNEVYRKDFEMEKEGRQTIFGEKQQLLQDLRALQKKNQELIELLKNNEKRYSSSTAGTSAPLISAAAAASQTYFNNPQRPIRALPQSSSPASPSVSPPSSLHHCIICNKAFKSLNVLQSHVNDCLDKN